MIRDTISTMRLDEGHRLLLLNQYHILEAVDPENKAMYQRARVIIERGYEHHYTELPGFSIMSTFGRQESEEVNDILNMFEAIQDALEGTTDESLKTDYTLTFRGFGGNQETAYMMYTEFLKQGQHWTHVGDPVKAYSPGPNLPRYRRMLNVWHALKDRFQLRDEQLRILAQAAKS